MILVMVRVRGLQAEGRGQAAAGPRGMSSGGGSGGGGGSRRRLAGAIGRFHEHHMAAVRSIG